jgi:RHS repeat-associated protein
VRLARVSLHLHDGARQVAIWDLRTAGSDAAPARLLRYQHTDHLGTVSLELDEAADPLGYEEYHPFGSTAFASHRGGSAPPAKRFRFTGKERDEETGLYYHGARYYAPWLGRWTSPDPAGVRPGEVSAYVYCRNRPVVLHDPDGAAPVGPGAGGAVGGGGATGLPPGMTPEYMPPTQVPPTVNPGPVSPGPVTRPGAGVAPRPGTGLNVRGAGAIFVALEVFVDIMTTPMNADTDYTARYTDPETGETKTFATYEQMDQYKLRRERERRDAPGPGGKPSEQKLPGDPSKQDPKVDPTPAERKDAPAADPAAESKDAPGALDEDDLRETARPDERPLTERERAAIMKRLKAEEPLDKEQKGLLRGEARWLWRQKTKGKGDQPGPDHQVHHLIPLEFAHLFPEMYPNSPTNLYLMPTHEHQRLHIQINAALRTMRAKRHVINRRKWEPIPKAIVEHYPGKLLSDVK